MVHYSVHLRLVLLRAEVEIFLDPAFSIHDIASVAQLKRPKNCKRVATLETMAFICSRRDKQTKGSALPARVGT